MARNQEKAQSILHRFRAARAEELGHARILDTRPKMTTEVTKLADCERWRHEVIREISQGVSKIQNPGLNDFQVRDLNDDINKLMREKRRWEDQIIHLGGPNYKRAAPKMLDEDGKEVPGSRGYRYFGRARDLPGVRELLEPEAPSITKNRYELYKNIDSDYYGYRDEEDSNLLAYEQQIEDELKSKGIGIFANVEEFQQFIKKPNELPIGIPGLTAGGDDRMETDD